MVDPINRGSNQQQVNNSPYTQQTTESQTNTATKKETGFGVKAVRIASAVLLTLGAGLLIAGVVLTGGAIVPAGIATGLLVAGGVATIAAFTGFSLSFSSFKSDRGPLEEMLPPRSNSQTDEAEEQTEVQTPPIRIPRAQLKADHNVNIELEDLGDNSQNQNENSSNN